VQFFADHAPHDVLDLRGGLLAFEVFAQYGVDRGLVVAATRIVMRSLPGVGSNAPRFPLLKS
jgi:hypothetical protein